MSTELKVAIIAGLIAIVGNIIVSLINNRAVMNKIEKQSEMSDLKLEAKMDRAQAITDTKLEELTREVREHNNFARRMPVLEERVDNIQKQINASA